MATPIVGVPLESATTSPSTGNVCATILLLDQLGVAVNLWWNGGVSFVSDGNFVAAFGTSTVNCKLSSDGTTWIAPIPAGLPPGHYRYYFWDFNGPTGAPPAANQLGWAEYDTETIPLLNEIYDALGGPLGPFTVTLTITDSDSNPVQGALVGLQLNNYLYNAVANGGTDGNQAVFNLDSGIYTVAITLYGYQFGGASLTITGNTAETYELTAVLVPVANGLCTIYDLQEIFGIPNINKWAILDQQDPNSSGGMAEIANRVAWAINIASTDFRNAMRQGAYALEANSGGALSLAGTDAVVWQTNLVAIMAGLYLYMHLKPTQRGEDGRPTPDKYNGLFTYAQEQLNWARAGKIRLDAAVVGKGVDAPFATHHRNRGAYGPGQRGYGPNQLPINFPWG
jgi:hypothetical protein